MKKRFLIYTAIILIVICTCLCPAFCQNAERVINLHTDGAYMIGLSERPIELKVSNENVLRAEVVTNLYSPESQIVIKSIEEGISYITFKTKSKQHSIKVLVDNNSPVDKDLTEIDKVREPKNN